MTTGMNKGDMLIYFLDRIKKSFKAIIFVDDNRKNVDDMIDKFSSTNTTDMTVFNYTKIISERLKQNDNHILTYDQAQKMTDDWRRLIETLNSIFPDRIQKSECTQ